MVRLARLARLALGVTLTIFLFFIWTRSWLEEDRSSPIHAKYPRIHSQNSMFTVLGKGRCCTFADVVEGRCCSSTAAVKCDAYGDREDLVLYNTSHLGSTSACQA